MIPVFNRLAHLSIGLLIGSSCAFSNAAKAAEVNPLRPVDTASPRETLQDFVVTMDGIYRGLKDILQEYAASERLYPTSDERRRQVEILSAAAKAIRVLDLSDIPPVLQQTVAAERAIQLKEILDRIELPSFDSVPDRNAAAGLPSKRWRLPETEIDIALIENGPRSGEYLVSAGTVDRLPEFYERVKKLPYKPGPAAELSDVYRKLSAGSTATIYDAYLSSPVGLERIVPIRWMLRLPAWAKSPIAGVALWQWLGHPALRPDDANPGADTVRAQPGPQEDRSGELSRRAVRDFSSKAKPCTSEHLTRSARSSPARSSTTSGYWPYWRWSDGTNFRGQQRKNDTHASVTDPASRLYRKAAGREAKLAYMGHAIMENRHGLAVAGQVTQADGTAERRTSEAMLKARRKAAGRRVTVGEDKAYDTAEHVAALRDLEVTPHVASNDAVTKTGKRRRSAIDGRTTRHPGYRMSQTRRAMIECIFGWGKQHGTMRRTKHRGIARVGADFLLNLIGYNLIRIPKLVSA